VIEPGILRRLEERGVGCCLIGAAALSVHGFARYSADVDLLVCDRRVLVSDFWIDCGDPEIRLGGTRIRFSAWSVGIGPQRSTSS
jgi:predicted nucleotidyltransferase